MNIWVLSEVSAPDVARRKPFNPSECLSVWNAVLRRLGYGRKALECLLCHREKRGRRRLRVRADDRRARWWVGHPQAESQVDFCLRGGTIRNRLLICTEALHKASNPAPRRDPGKAQLPESTVTGGGPSHQVLSRDGTPRICT